VPAPALRVLGVAEGGNAAKAGVKAGDLLLAYDGRILDSRDDLFAAIEAAAKKEEVAVVVYRGAERVEVKLAPGRMGVELAGP
jgi:putative serine protease PepD